eukprot:3463492-Alexandrium_andersonii.AAC.2
MTCARGADRRSSCFRTTRPSGAAWFAVTVAAKATQGPSVEAAPLRACLQVSWEGSASGRERSAGDWRQQGRPQSRSGHGRSEGGPSPRRALQPRWRCQTAQTTVATRLHSCNAAVANSSTSAELGAPRVPQCRRTCRPPHVSPAAHRRGPRRPRSCVRGPVLPQTGWRQHGQPGGQGACPPCPPQLSPWAGPSGGRSSQWRGGGGQRPGASQRWCLGASSPRAAATASRAASAAVSSSRRRLAASWASGRGLPGPALAARPGCMSRGDGWAARPRLLGAAVGSAGARARGVRGLAELASVRPVRPTGTAGLASLELRSCSSPSLSR